VFKPIWSSVSAVVSRVFSTDHEWMLLLVGLVRTLIIPVAAKPAMAPNETFEGTWSIDPWQVRRACAARKVDGLAGLETLRSDIREASASADGPVAGGVATT